jgi:hypothetical protein
MSKFRDVIARMAVDSEFARRARANPDQVAREHRLTADETAKLRGLADARSGTGPTALEARLSKSGIGSGGLGGVVTELAGGPSQPLPPVEEQPQQLEIEEEEEQQPQQLQVTEEPQQLQIGQEQPIQLGVGTAQPGLSPDQQGEFVSGVGDNPAQPPPQNPPGPGDQSSTLIPGGSSPSDPGGPTAQFPEGYTPPYTPEGIGGPESELPSHPESPPPQQVPDPAPPDAGPPDAPAPAPQPQPAPPPDQPAPAPDQPSAPLAGPDQPAVAFGSPATPFAGSPAAVPAPAAAPGFGGVSGQAQSLLPAAPVTQAPVGDDGIGAKEIAIGAAGAAAGAVAGGFAGAVAGKSTGQSGADESPAQPELGPGPQPAT